MSFFRVLVDSSAKDLWFPDDPLDENGNEIDSREFIVGQTYSGPSPFRVPLFRKGNPSDFTLAAFNMPVVSQRVAQILEKICPAEIQRFPVAVGSCESGYEILNVTSTAICLDEQKSKIQKWTQEDSRPEKVGQYRMVIDLAIDPVQASGRHIFRISGWEIALIVSDVVRRGLEETGNLSVVFCPVCP